MAKAKKKKGFVAKPPMKRRGIDVSSHNGDVDWDKVASDPKIGFAFVKVSEGLTWKDPTYTTGRVKAIRKAGIPFGVYHFARPQEGRSGASEADEFIDAALAGGWGKKGDLRGVLDIEHSRGSKMNTIKFVRDFVKQYVKRTGQRPIIYTGHFWRDFLGNPIMAVKCPLWLAAYTESWRPWMPKAWAAGRPFFWQWTERGSQKGVTGYVDLNKYMRNRDDFEFIRLPRDIGPSK